MSLPRSPEAIASVKRRVLPAAARLYLEKGFSRTTVINLAAASGVNVNLIMQVLKSKEAIQFVSRFDYPQLARSTIDAMLSRLEQPTQPE